MKRPNPSPTILINLAWGLLIILFMGLLQVALASVPLSIKKNLDMLPGFWAGEAVTTPVGPMNYDMLFHTCIDGTTAGVAKTGASLHYWQFQLNNDSYRLRFLSTFAGNRKPVMLLPSEYDGTVVKFYAPELKLLTLTIGFSEQTTNIRIYHHDKPHVHIRLNRVDDKPAITATHHTLVNSCRGYPVE